MPTDLTGRCLCGAITVTMGAPAKFGIRCYCRDCQHVSGSSHADQVGFDKSVVTVDGPLKTHSGTAPSGSTLGFQFCGSCGAPVLKSTTRAPDLVFVYAGVLDDPSAVPELKPVFTESRPPWD